MLLLLWHGESVLLPGLVDEGEIPDANAKLFLGVGVSLVVGPLLAAVLADVTSPPVVLGLDGLTYLVSALVIRRLRVSGQAWDAYVPRAPCGVILESARWALRHPSVPALLACRLGTALFTGMAGTVAMYYRLDVLKLSPATIGLLNTLTSPGFLAGPAMTGFLIRRIGPGRVDFGGAVLLALGSMALPAARGDLLTICALLALGGALADVGSMAYHAMDQSLIQMVVPLGRRPQVVALANALSQAGGVLGPLAGSVLSHSVAAVLILWISCVGLLLSPLPMVFTPLVRGEAWATGEALQS